MTVDRDHVARRLCDAREWALYIHAALTRDERYEPGKQELLEALADAPELRALQDESRVLAGRLDALVGRLAVRDPQDLALRRATTPARSDLG